VPSIVAPGFQPMRIVRYADDFVVMIHGTRDDAEAHWAEVTSVLAPIGLEAQRIGVGVGDQRFRQSMSLAVSRKVTARVSWARRCAGLRSVFRRS